MTLNYDNPYLTFEPKINTAPEISTKSVRRAMLNPLIALMQVLLCGLVIKMTSMPKITSSPLIATKNQINSTNCNTSLWT